MISRCLTSLIPIAFLLLPQAISPEGMASLTATAQQAAPAALQSCIRRLNTKRTPIQAAVVRGKYQQQGKTFYHLSLFPTGMKFGVRDAIVSTSSSGCQVLAQYPSSSSIPVKASIPRAVARGLALNIMKSDIYEFGGHKKYQSFLNSAAQDTGRLYLGPNEVWALKQLGIKIAPSIKIVAP